MYQSDRNPAYGRRVNPMLTAAYRTGRKPGNYGKRYPAEVYTAEEVLRAMSFCGRGPGGYRNRALIAVMWRSGLRVSEALDLVPRDVDFELGAILVRHGKGDARRLVHMDAQTAALVELWAKGPRARLGLGPNAPLFCTYERGAAGQPLRGAYVRDALKRAGRRAGIPRFHPHGLRHTFAFELRREHVDLPTISEALGHKDYGTTQRYISHLAPLERIEELNRRAWPSSNGDGLGPRPAAGPRNS